MQFETIPMFSSAHGFLKPAQSESDPLYNQLLAKIGFTDWRGHLMYEKQRGHSGLDKVTLTVIALHSLTSAQYILNNHVHYQPHVN